jgi:hypothetical protein
MPQPINRDYIITLKKKEYPMWPGILDAATRDGLRKLETTIIQAPSKENGQMAIVLARAEFEDGRVFQDLGDCSPDNTTPGIATASVRMASTRAKGRALRDSQNIGQTMFEELPDLDKMADASSETGVPADAPQRLGAQPAADKGKLECSNPDCGKPLTVGQQSVSVAAYGQPLCPACQKLKKSERKAA